MNRNKMLAYTTVAILLGTGLATAQDEAVSPALFAANNAWMMLCTALVFIMHLGFACVETGFTQSKNTVNILFKNAAIVCIGILTYALCGFNLMYPVIPGVDLAGGYFAFAGFGIAPPESGQTVAYHAGTYTYYTDFLFQAMFAATAATIVSGAVAERIKLGPFLIFATLFVAISYPITGYWKWGNGWLNVMKTPFYDFAGSTLVHTVGGWAALVGAIILGPRIGKYTAGGIRPILGHSMPLGTIGVFMLWLGWFGFNGGSVKSADPNLTSLTLVTTNIAAAAGSISAMLTTWILFKKPDLGIMLNGTLAGLVGITAGADQMNALDATWIGLIAGIIVVFSIQFFDKIKIDDPVGAISVHLVCGIWGTLAVAIFGNLAEKEGQLMSQIKGIVSIGAFTVIFSLLLFLVIKAIFGLRVDEKEEINGLDESEHGAEAYPDFSPAPGHH